MVSFDMAIVGERKLILLGNPNPQNWRLSKGISIVERSQIMRPVQRTYIDVR
jgi:hypothetical protein